MNTTCSYCFIVRVTKHLITYFRWMQSPLPLVCTHLVRKRLKLLMHIDDQFYCVLVKHKSWKVRMNPGRDPTESFFRVDCYQCCEHHWCTKRSGPHLYSNAHRVRVSQPFEGLICDKHLQYVQTEK